mmetsp:Transcript_139829/g.260778  ORF Transcript_139829/g.260778 Transcript_139829/m.260778 type:complete len:260 (+) Transcript_139829:3-782(+)
MVVSEVRGDQILSETMVKRLTDNWGSLAVSMLSLFMSISGGVSWIDVVTPLWEVDQAWLYTYLVFISFTYFAVLNVVTGVFCQSAIESSQQDQETMVQAFLSHKNLHMARFKHLFAMLDKDNTGMITEEQFLEHVDDAQVGAYFATLGLETTDAVYLFKMLNDDEDEDGIDIEDFVQGCLRLKGTAKSCDVARLMHENKVMLRELTSFIGHAEEEFEKIIDKLSPESRRLGLKTQRFGSKRIQLRGSPRVSALTAVSGK